ncbi:tRNA U34 carboxymethyltransferase [Candidatus Profftia lariciata]|uniref:tRNA 5-methoxyuridine(34)/uridine 5-oxyacetic acid(34) synthase CmoB n=1 Tax=Candidatus Profftia lariciata TaxID=1987921 RepID=UPI001D002645|nr:tRNA 5-methoxyuridine(34)/uridine 5-oxyacetic acid(34) synthase CmoB [Candidatus Profftia lariciata]UDG81431.1 tRNA U34 carboxymethyltransferase [Candidatus Profftia lariciata]
MIKFDKFYKIIANSKLSNWLEILPTQLTIWQRSSLHSKFIYWRNIVKNLPKITPYYLNLLNSVSAQGKTELCSSIKKDIKIMLRALMPWRKGPFNCYGIYIDTEWRSDFKWNRVLPHLSLLKGRTVLDVGCGNGYHLWRMIGAGAKLAIGIDPMALFLCQFEAIRKLLGQDQRVHMLPLGIEQLPKLAAFDTVFSMGVLYHRRSPLDHINQLKDQLVQYGELVIETIIIEGDDNQILVPYERYAQMRNVYCIPSIQLLIKWLTACGFIDVRAVHTCRTTPYEQRCTNWMTKNSLVNFLDPNNHKKTIEGHPAPIRSIIIARKP